MNNKRIPCDCCGLPIPEPPEGADPDALLCDKCYAMIERKEIA